MNGMDIKPSREVHVGDVINVRKGAIQYTYKVKDLIEKRVGAKLVENYAENLTPQSEIDKLHAPVETIFMKRDRGSGRPTKKERRELDFLMDNMDYDDEEIDM